MSTRSQGTVPSMTQSFSPRPSITSWRAVSIALLAVGALCLGFGLGLDRAEKVLSIVGSLAGVAGAATGIVALLRNRAATAASPQRDVPPGGVQAGRDIHIGHKVNTGGVLAVGGIWPHSTWRLVPPGWPGRRQATSTSRT